MDNGISHSERNAPVTSWLDSFLKKIPPPSFTVILAIRIVNSLTIQTFFQADEYWQSLEPAHKAIFGYGSLTWEWHYGLRSYLHPLLYMLPYWIIRNLNLESSIEYNYVLIAPKIVNALIASIGDYYLYHLMIKKLNNKNNNNLAKLICFLSLLSPWNWYCWCRSFANSLELTLTIVSLYYLYSNQIISCLFIAAFTCLIRPTNSIIWIFYLPKLFWKKPINILYSIMIAFFVLSFDSLLNYYFYSNWKLPLWNFFKFNVFDSLSSFYGTSRLDFYFFQAIPILLLNYLPFFINGFISSYDKEFKYLLLFYISIFTLIPHKEFRFIYPLMPILLYFSAIGLLNISNKVSTNITKLIILITIIISTLLSYYFTQIHEIGELQITNLIHNKVIDDNSNELINIGFLTPCHSTPFQSHIHLSDNLAKIWFLTCEPPLPSNLLPGSNIENYMDESDYFYDNPLLFLKNNFPHLKDFGNNSQNNSPKTSQWPHEWPNYLIIYDNLWYDENNHIKEYLENDYKIDEILWNSLGHWDNRREGNILLLKHI